MIYNSFLKKIVVVIVGPVDMWITIILSRKNSLSTCGQTVYKPQLVINSIQLAFMLSIDH